MSVVSLPTPATGPVTTLSSGGKYIAIGNGEGLVTVLNAITQDLVFVGSGHEGPVSVLSWSQDGAMLASGGQDQRVRVWDVRRGCIVCTFGHSGWSPPWPGLQTEDSWYRPVARSSRDGTLPRSSNNQPEAPM